MKKIILLIIGLALSLSLAVPMTANAGSFLGKYCFKYTSYGDTWVWYVDNVGGAYAVTGIDLVYTPDSSMDGGGAVTAGILYLTVDERIAMAGGPGISTNAEHNIKLNLTTLTGTDYLTWFDMDGNKTYSYPTGLAFGLVTCPLDADAAPVGTTTAGQ